MNFTKIKNKTWVQIGANVGNDHFHKLCTKYSPKCVILIEPVPECQEQLKECYKTFQNPVYFEKVAIVNNPLITEVELRSPTGFSGHMSVVPLADWEDKTRIPAKASTISQIFEKYKLLDIGLLFIDTEGNDARIIDSIDFGKYHIDMIVYEAWNFQQDAFPEYNQLNGLDGMQYIRTKLELNGYKVEDASVVGEEADMFNPKENYIASKL